MQIVYFSLIIIAAIIYQICAKQIPEGLNPLFTLIMTYGSALAVTLVIYLATKLFYAPGTSDLHKLNYAPFLLGAFLPLYEVGFIMAYRSGFKSSQLLSLVNVAMMAVMLAIGVWLFREKVSVRQIIGLGFAMAGILIAML